MTIHHYNALCFFPPDWRACVTTPWNMEAVQVLSILLVLCVNLAYCGTDFVFGIFTEHLRNTARISIVLLTTQHGKNEGRRICGRMQRNRDLKQTTTATTTATTTSGSPNIRFNEQNNDYQYTCVTSLCHPLQNITGGFINDDGDSGYDCCNSVNLFSTPIGLRPCSG